MILGYIGGIEENPLLALVADKPSPWSRPLPVDQLETTDCSVVLLSNQEGITVRPDEQQQQTKLIEPVRPSKLYLTPNLPEKPGFSVDKLKITPLSERKYKVFFDRGKGWEPWTPNIKLY